MGEQLEGVADEFHGSLSHGSLGGDDGPRGDLAGSQLATVNGHRSSELSCVLHPGKSGSSVAEHF